MSLDYNLTKIKNREEVTIVHDEGGDHLSPVTQAIIFATMSNYMGEITEANYQEFFTRYRVWNQTHGYDDGFTVEDVQRHIGLYTNVFPKKPLTKWFKEHIWRDAEYDTRHPGRKESRNVHQGTGHDD